MPRVLVLLGRLALGAVFLYAAYTKLLPPGKISPVHLGSQIELALSLFAMQVDSYQLLPPWAVNLVARSLPWFELALGLLLVVGSKLRYVASVASGVLLIFFSLMLRAHLKGQEINCGCFGPNERIGVETLVRDGTLLLVSLAVTAGAFLLAGPERRIDTEKPSIRTE